MKSRKPYDNRDSTGSFLLSSYNRNVRVRVLITAQLFLISTH